MVERKYLKYERMRRERRREMMEREYPTISMYPVVSSTHRFHSEFHSTINNNLTIE